ncbi:MAG: hypothetical protein AAGG68_17840 [Bacteroidota bacterium]
MYFFKEIASFIRAHHIYQGQALGYKKRKHTQSQKLYERILEEENFESDEDIALAMYGTFDWKYRDLKRRFLNNLITSVLMIEFDGQRMPKYNRKYYSLLRELTVAKILLGKTLHQSAIFFTKRCYKKAKQYAFYDILEETTRILRNHYGRRIFREADFLNYSNELVQIRKVIELEDKADSYYSHILITHRKNRPQLHESTDLAMKYFEELSTDIATCPSLKFQVSSRLIRLFISASKSDFITMYSHVNDDIAYFREHQLDRGNALYIFLGQKTLVCVRLGKYGEGLDSILLASSIVDETNVNWFPTKYNEFFIYMQSGRYQEAQDLYLKITNHRRYKNLVPNMKEDWIVGGAYLNYLIEKGELEAHSKFKFRVGKFVNSVPEYSKDRRVKNVPILIAQIIFMIYRRQTSKVIDRMDAIKQYCGRNLRYNEAVRSNSFIMALMEIPKRSFNRIAVERHIGRYRKRLEEVPIHLSGKNFDLEIIPYERLLKYVLEDL